MQIAFPSKSPKPMVYVLAWMRHFHTVSWKYFYHFLISPYLSYCIESWCGAPKYALDRMLILQKKAICNIHKLPLNHHTLSFFKSTDILKLPELYHFKLGFHMYKIATNQNQYIHSANHSYDTQNINNFPIPEINLSMSQFSLHYRVISLWNSSPAHLKKSKSLFAFKRNFKLFLLSSY